ncbi:MAG: hypothetical protein MSH25_10090 [Desulfovibrio sp.]|uniref:hypothetical protein n=1 Tax=Desulfovibrio sp. TaxID=885 RepID=UPI0025BD80DC|nr:hypothetical protein [Desulfovibrio sp.]MCI7569689.1 hypothetical protein [Desulfovibrio sp.]
MADSPQDALQAAVSGQFSIETILFPMSATMTPYVARYMHQHTTSRKKDAFIARDEVILPHYRPRRPAQSERKNRVFSAKRQAVWFEMRSISN